MRIPHIIKKNTVKTYEPSSESKNLIHENDRKVFAEDFNWNNSHCPELKDLCVEVINRNFEKEQILDELLCPDRNYLLEILDTNLPLEIVLPLIDDEIYWERRYHAKFGSIILTRCTSIPSWCWKVVYVERHMQEIIEQAQPEHNDEYEMEDLTKMCAPYVRKLLVTQLQMWKPPLHWDEEDIPEIYPIDHIDFAPIFKQLVNIEEFDVIYGMNNVSEKFHWNMFKVSVLDCQRLGKAIGHLKSIRILKIHKSRLEDQHTRVLVQGLIKNQTIEELDLSHCSIGNEGAICIAKLLTVHPKLRKLNLCDNKIETPGCEGIGFALLEPDCQLEVLDLKLNPLHEGGAMGIMRALVRGTSLVELSMAACLLDDEAPIRTGQMLKLNTTLKKLDVSNNWFDTEGGFALVEGLAANRTLHWFDVRETDITSEQENLIKKYLLRNRLNKDDIDESSDDNDDDDDGDVEVEEQVAEVNEENAVSEKNEE